MYRRKVLYLKFTFFQFLFKYVSLFAIFSSDSNFQSMKYRVMSNSLSCLNRKEVKKAKLHIYFFVKIKNMQIVRQRSRACVGCT